MNTQSDEDMDSLFPDLVGISYADRLDAQRKIWGPYLKGDKYEPDLSSLPGYELGFDYVAPGTFEDETEGYFRYDLCYAAPAYYFRFFINPDFTIRRIEYHFLENDESDAVAHQVLTGQDYDLMEKIYEYYLEIGSVESEYGDSTGNFLKSPYHDYWTAKGQQPDRTRESYTSSIDFEYIYLIGRAITGVIVFIGCWIYAIGTYGFLLGVGLGWIPSFIVAAIASFLWPLIALALLTLAVLILGSVI